MTAKDRAKHILFIFDFSFENAIRCVEEIELAMVAINNDDMVDYFIEVKNELLKQQNNTNQP